MTPLKKAQRKKAQDQVWKNSNIQGSGRRGRTDKDTENEGQRKQGEIERIHFNKTKTIYNRPKAHLIVNGERLKAFPLRLGKRKGYLHT